MLGTPRSALLRRAYGPVALPGVVVGLWLGVSLGWTSEIVGMLCVALLWLVSDTAIRLVTEPWTRWARS